MLALVLCLALLPTAALGFHVDRSAEVWHSGIRPCGGNQLTPITPLAERCTFTVIKLE